MRLIDADRFVKENREAVLNALKEAYYLPEEYATVYKSAVEACLHNLEIADEVDAEPVVRCKDCKWFDEKSYAERDGFCDNEYLHDSIDSNGEFHCLTVDKDFFCKFGERAERT